MATPRLATYSIGGVTKYGAVSDSGIVDLSARFGKEYPTLREVIAAGALMKLVDEGARHQPDHALDAITWQPPIPGAPDPKRDVAACAAVREAVGPDMPLMIDPPTVTPAMRPLLIMEPV